MFKKIISVLLIVITSLVSIPIVTIVLRHVFDGNFSFLPLMFVVMLFVHLSRNLVYAITPSWPKWMLD